MRKVGRKHRSAQEKFAEKIVKTLEDALSVIVDTVHVLFDESVDVAVKLGIDPSKGEQTVRGSILLPHGIGKNVRVLVFAKGDHVDAAKAAGADFVGLDELIEKVAAGWMDFDAAVATPDVMGQVGKVAKILGPRGLLPSKKVGTVTFDVAQIVADLKKGRVSYRNDKCGIVHAPFGRVSFGGEKLKDNFLSLIKSIIANKPATAKGKFIQKITISSTMGVGVSISPESVI